MSDDAFNPDYVIHSDEEPRRLDRQAAIYGSQDDLQHLRPASGEHLLDAGCGSGSISRSIARHQPGCSVTGVDREARYIEYANRQARSEGLGNARFEVGDVTRLPFENGRFDVVWSKHLLQWVAQREQALAEFKRVTRKGGRIVCCNFDRFCLSQYPVDERTQGELEQWFAAAHKAFGFDNDLGRKLPHLFKALGLQDIKVNFIPDRAFSGFGGDPEKRWNWEMQFNSAFPFSVQVFGGEKAARAFTDRVIDRFNDPDVYLYCTLFYVEGTVA